MKEIIKNFYSTKQPKQNEKKIAKNQYPVSVNAWHINKDKRTEFKIGQSDEQPVNTGRNMLSTNT